MRIARGLGSRIEFTGYAKLSVLSVHNNLVSWIPDVHAPVLSTRKRGTLLYGELVVGIVLSFVANDTTTEIQRIFGVTKGSGLANGKGRKDKDGVDDLHVGIDVWWLAFAR